MPVPYVILSFVLTGDTVSLQFAIVFLVLLRLDTTEGGSSIFNSIRRIFYIMKIVK